MHASLFSDVMKIILANNMNEKLYNS